MPDMTHYRHIYNRAKKRFYRFGRSHDKNERQNLYNYMQGEIAPELFIRYTRLYAPDYQLKQVAIVLMGIGLGPEHFDKIKEHMEIMAGIE